ncbi:hypothetical protein KDRO_E05150 [Kluyveromyces lactis]|nr:hypothetical protein KDRO_E05150 [Kluyveromyces lactis]
MSGPDLSLKRNELRSRPLGRNSKDDLNGSYLGKVMIKLVDTDSIKGFSRSLKDLSRVSDQQTYHILLFLCRMPITDCGCCLSRSYYWFFSDSSPCSHRMFTHQSKSNDLSVATTFFIVNSLHCIYKTQVQSNFLRWVEFDVLLMAFNVISLIYVSLTKKK